MRGATRHRGVRHQRMAISIHAPHAGSDSSVWWAGRFLSISIHAPHAGSDAEEDAMRAAKDNFNPRSPCGERRVPSYTLGLILLFQSTLPMRGATRVSSISCRVFIISIHAPHAGSDTVTKALTTIF